MGNSTPFIQPFTQKLFGLQTCVRCYFIGNCTSLCKTKIYNYPLTFFELWSWSETPKIMDRSMALVLYKVQFQRNLNMKSHTSYAAFTGSPVSQPFWDLDPSSLMWRKKWDLDTKLSIACSRVVSSICHPSLDSHTISPWVHEFDIKFSIVQFSIIPIQYVPV